MTPKTGMGAAQALRSERVWVDVEADQILTQIVYDKHSYRN